MKAAIPTNDGLMMAPTFENAGGFLVLNIELGKVVDQEMIWNKPGEMTASPESYISLIKDCSVVISENITAPFKAVLEQRKIRHISSPDRIITNAIVHYVEHEVRKAADTCCCP
jgi:predicted Fe-Mo cluster-binding NifX family protein